MRYIGVDRVYHGKKLVVISGIWFHDELTRTSAGWRIHKRHEELAWRHSFPEEFVPPVPAG